MLFESSIAEKFRQGFWLVGQLKLATAGAGRENLSDDP